MGYYSRSAGALIVLVLLSGCMGVKKATRVMKEHPKELAKLCSESFPVKESEVKEGRVIVLPSDTVVVESTDTVVVTANCPDGTKVKTKCPPCKERIVTKNSIRVDTLKIRDTAYEEVLIHKVKRGDNWKVFGLIGWGILGFLLLAWAIGNRKRG